MPSTDQDFANSGTTFEWHSIPAASSGTGEPPEVVRSADEGSPSGSRNPSAACARLGGNMPSRCRSKSSRTPWQAFHFNVQLWMFNVRCLPSTGQNLFLPHPSFDIRKLGIRHSPLVPANPPASPCSTAKLATAAGSHLRFPLVLRRSRRGIQRSPAPANRPNVAPFGTPPCSGNRFWAPPQGSPISSFQTLGFASMKRRIRSTHLSLCTTSISTPRLFSSSSSPMKVWFSPITTFGIP